jgi:hypothetical protein
MSSLLNLEALLEWGNKLPLPCRLCKKNLNTGHGQELLPRMYVHICLRHPEVNTDELLRVLLKLINATPEQLQEAFEVGVEQGHDSLAKMGFLHRFGRG